MKSIDLAAFKSQIDEKTNDYESLAENCIINAAGVSPKPLDKTALRLLSRMEQLIVKSGKQNYSLHFPCSPEELVGWAALNGFTACLSQGFLKTYQPGHRPVEGISVEELLNDEISCLLQQIDINHNRVLTLCAWQNLLEYQAEELESANSLTKQEQQLLQNLIAKIDEIDQLLEQHAPNEQETAYSDDKLHRLISRPQLNLIFPTVDWRNHFTRKTKENNLGDFNRGQPGKPAYLLKDICHWLMIKALMTKAEIKAAIQLYDEGQQIQASQTLPTSKTKSADSKTRQQLLNTISKCTAKR